MRLLIFALILLNSAVFATEPTSINKRNLNQLKLIRNATMKFTYSGITFLTDPMLSSKGTLPSFAGKADNPIVELPMVLDDVLNDIDCLIISHTHPDHFDSFAQKILDKKLLVLCQPEDKEKILMAGFEQIIGIDDSYKLGDVTIHRVDGQHGSGEILELMGTVSGFVFESEGQPTVYWVGDSIWCDEVADVVQKFAPDVIITHSGGATIPGYPPILMNAEQTIQVATIASEAKVIAVHMEALDHCETSRKNLQQSATAAGFSSNRIIIPEDGETIGF